MQYRVRRLGVIMYGPWVGVIYNQWDGPDKAQRTYDFFHDKIFRDDSSYSRFPVNAAFGPDLQANRNALMTFLLSGESYQGLVQPDKILEALRETINFGPIQKVGRVKATSITGC